MNVRWARRWHVLTALVATGAVLLQLILVIEGSAILAEVDPPGLATRLGRFVSYFTIQSNVLVAVAAVTLGRDPMRDGDGWRVLRIAGVVGIAVTGLVHFFLLRPLLDLDGLDRLADSLLHLVVPLVALGGWLLFGPRPRVSLRAVGYAIIWPLAWLAWTLLLGELSGWYPYPFLDVGLHGWSSVLVACAGVTVLLLVAFGAGAAFDRLAAGQPQPEVGS